MATGTMSKVIQHIRRVIPPCDDADVTDEKLLARFIAGDEAAFAVLVRRHGPMVWGVCRRILGSVQDAEDAFQASFLVLVRKASSIVKRELLANWLYGVAQRTALKARSAALRRRRRERQLTHLPEVEVAPPGKEPDVRGLLDQELSRLADKYRVPIVLCDLEGKTRREAARQLCIPEGTVAGRLVRARGLLAKGLRRRGLALSMPAIITALSQNAAAACVPAALVVSTLKNVSLLTAVPAAAGVVPAPVAALADGVLKALLFNKVLKATAFVLFIVAVVSGTGFVLSHAAGIAEPEGKASIVAVAALGLPKGAVAVAPENDAVKKEGRPARKTEKADNPKQAPAYQALNIEDVIPELRDVAALQSRKLVSRVKQPTTFCTGFRFRFPYGPPGAAITYSVAKPENHYVWPPKVDATTPNGRKAIYQKLEGAYKGGHFTMDGNELLVFGDVRIVPFTFKDERVRQAWLDLFIRVPREKFAEFVKEQQAAAKVAAGPIAGSYTLPLAKSSYFAALTSDNQVVILWIEQTLEEFRYNVSHYLLSENR